MVQIDPSLACVWRSPSSLQLGVDPVRVRLDSVTSAEERILVALLAGVDDRRLTEIATSAGTSLDGLAELIALLGPALMTAARRRGLRIAIERAVPDEPDVPPFASSRYDDRLLAHHLGALGHELVSRHGSARRRQPELALLVADHVVSPSAAQHWLSRGVPHLPVVTSDQAARIGPLVLPGITACLHCAALHQIDEDPAWPAVAAQLASPQRRSASSGRPELALEAVLFVGRMADRLRPAGAGGPAGIARAAAAGAAAGVGLTGLVWRIDSDGSVSESGLAPHPRCGCQALAAAARSGTAKAAAATTGGARRSRTTVAAPRGLG